jgi:hypothetical protein
MNQDGSLIQVSVGATLSTYFKTHGECPKAVENGGLVREGIAHERRHPGTNEMVDKKHSAAAGQAALSICESLLASISELKVMSDKDVRDLLEDAATTHHQASRDSDDAALHEEVALVIEQIMAQK